MCIYDGHRAQDGDGWATTRQLVNWKLPRAPTRTPSLPLVSLSLSLSLSLCVCVCVCVCTRARANKVKVPLSTTGV